MHLELHGNKNHPEVSNIANTLLSLGQPTEALEILRKLEKKESKIVNIEHKDIIFTQKCKAQT